MRDTVPSAATRIATGVAVGLIAGLAASLAMNRFQALTQSSSAAGSEPATDQVADRITQAVRDAPLSGAARPTGGQLVHYGMGAVLGVGYGVAAEFMPKVTSGAGTAFATLVWALLDETAVPAAGLGNPPWKTPARTHVYSLVSHMVFGLAAETTRRLARSAVESATAERQVAPTAVQ